MGWFSPAIALIDNPSSLKFATSNKTGGNSSNFYNGLI